MNFCGRRAKRRAVVERVYAAPPPDSTTHSIQQARHDSLDVLPAFDVLCLAREITLRPGRGGGQAKTSWWIVRLAEGRTRQIREMFLRGGHPVQRLRRVSIGTLRDSTLALGGHRELLPAEVEALRRGTEASRRPPNRRRPRAKR